MEKEAKRIPRNLGVPWIVSRPPWTRSNSLGIETVPSVLYILMRHDDDLEEAIVRAVNDTWDNDTIAAIVRAGVGALHGRRRTPARWLAKLLGRTTDRDDGRVFALLQQAQKRWA